MNLKVKEVYPLENYFLKIIFNNGEERFFDVKPYLHKGIFKELQDLRLFASVKPALGSVQWANGQDFCPDTLYIESVDASNQE